MFIYAGLLERTQQSCQISKLGNVHLCSYLCSAGIPKIAIKKESEGQF